MSNSYFILTPFENEEASHLLHNEAGATCDIFTEWEEGRRFFVKKLKPEFRGKELYENAFRKEYEIGSMLDSPYLPRYIRMDEDCSIYEEYVDGMTLDRFIESEPQYFSEKKNIERFTRELMEALVYLHSRQILHLDIKPQNVMITRMGNNVKIVDLGFSYSDSFITTAGTTKDFAAPELMDGSTLPNTFADIYSSGMLLHYIEERMGTTLHEPCHTVAERCTNSDAKARFQSAEEVLEFLLKSGSRKSAITGKRVAVTLIISVIALTALALTRLLATPPEEFHYNDYLICRTVSADSLTVMFTHDSTAVYKLGNPEIDITIPSTISHDGYTFTVTQIGSKTFYACKPLVAIVLPQTLERIEHHAFYGCDSITNINIPDNVTYIGTDAFRKCTTLNSIRLPQRLKRIEKGLFSLCTSLREVIVPDSVRELGRDAFGECKKLEAVTLPQGLTTIERGVFWHCEALKSLTIPSTVTSFGDFVFWGCESLTDITMLNPEPPRITNIFGKHHVRIHVPAASVDKYRNLQYWKDQEIIAME